MAPEVSVGLASQDSRETDGSSAQVFGSSAFQGYPLFLPAARPVPCPAVGAGAGLSLGVVGERSGPGGSEDRVAGGEVLVVGACQPRVQASTLHSSPVFR